MSSNNPIYAYQLRALNKEFNQHCIDSCVEFATTGKISQKEETCLRNCNSKISQYKKYAKECGSPIK